MKTVELGRSGRKITRIGLGAMPLSIQGRPDREVGFEVIRRTVELGVSWIDTADVYCLDDDDIGHNERLIHEALGEGEAREEVLVATKGGMVRPQGRWETLGSPDHLKEACERSLRALGTERIDLYQFHGPDPAVPFEASIAALGELREEGKVAAVGLSNVSLEQLQKAQAIVPVDSVQNLYNPWNRSDEESGLLDYCDLSRVTYIPYSPVGGSSRVHTLRRNPALHEIGREVGASPEELVLAWMLGQTGTLAPIPGASRPESIESSVRAEGLALEREVLDRVEGAFATL
jgi:aryl-alcohol dehydrogenase-like predicted oxidoreductase